MLGSYCLRSVPQIFHVLKICSLQIGGELNYALEPIRNSIDASLYPWRWCENLDTWDGKRVLKA